MLHLRQSLLCLKSSQNLVLKQQQCFRKYENNVRPEASQASTHYLNRISSVNLNTEVMKDWMADKNHCLMQRAGVRDDIIVVVINGSHRTVPVWPKRNGGCSSAGSVPVMKYQQRSCESSQAENPTFPSSPACHQPLCGTCFQKRNPSLKKKKQLKKKLNKVSFPQCQHSVDVPH